MIKDKNMKAIDFLKNNTTLRESTKIGLEGFMGYHSNIDDSYVTSDPKDIEWMMKLGITEQVQSFNGGTVSCIGFNPVEKKWYGWSHRAVFGFGIGSKVSKENCGYIPANKDDFIERNLHFWGDIGDEDSYKINLRAIETTQDGKLGVLIQYEYNNDVPNKEMRGQTSEIFDPYPDKYGKGEWEAETLEEAKEMAIDFAKSVG